MDYFLSDEQKELISLVKKFAEEKIKPIRSEMDRESKFPHEIIKGLMDIGMYRLFVPEKYGGHLHSIFNLCLVVEQIARIDGGTAIAYAGTGLGSLPLVIAGNEEQNEKYLSKVADGAYQAAFALTEPEAGSDAASVSTKAIKKGDRYILNGRKRFITGAGIADFYVVIATTAPDRGVRGLSAFIVEKGVPGFSFGEPEDKMGIRASVQRDLIFEDVEIPVENLLGQEGEGFRIAMMTLERSRPIVAAQALGIAQGAFEEALRYAKGRVQFGQPIISFQAIQFMLADMAIQIEAARSLVYSVARYVDSGGKLMAKVSAIAKTFASDVAMKITTDAVQILGGYGYMKNYPVEKYMRDAKITQIYEGTNQIQRLVIARSLLREYQ